MLFEPRRWAVGVGCVVVGLVVWGGGCAVAQPAAATPAVEPAKEEDAHVPNLKVTAVPPMAQTEDVNSTDDAADDPAIWINTADPSKSLVLGTDKRLGLGVYALDGKRVQFFEVGRVNNVDVRTGFTLSNGRVVDIAAASQRDKRSIELFAIEPKTGVVSHDVAAREIVTGLKEPYGIAMYKSAKTGAIHVFVGDKETKVEQWQLVATADGKIDAKLVRSFSRPTQSEGMVADDVTGVFYIAEEAGTIYSLAAEPDSSNPSAEVVFTKFAGTDTAPIVPDAEGLAIVRPASPKPGEPAAYFIVSSQGDSTFAVFDLAAAKFLGSFRVGQMTLAGMDAVEETDGIEATASAAGPTFPGGLFVAQDGMRPFGKTQNFKLVRWDAIQHVILSESKKAPTSAPGSGTKK